MTNEERRCMPYYYILSFEFKTKYTINTVHDLCIYEWCVILILTCTLVLSVTPRLNIALPIV